jgi:hypothetical protein
MSDIDIAARYARKIELLLESRLQAQGLNLHERLADVQRHLPDRIVHQALCVALVRDDIMLNPDLVIKDRESFEAAAHEVLAYLATAQRVSVGPVLKSHRRGFVGEFVSLATAAAGALMLFIALGAAIWSNIDLENQRTDSRPPGELNLPQIGK